MNEDKPYNWDDPWHPNCRLSVGVRTESPPGEVALSVRLRGRKDVRGAIMDTIFGRHTNVDHEYDMVFVWRCQCEHHWHVDFITRADLPATIGYHHACPICGACPIEVSP